MLGFWILCFEFDWWMEGYGLIVVGNWLISWLWEIEGKDDDFELWFYLNGEIVLEIRRWQ
jgi:hypothetical protein